jgi:exopolysaccharide biosynthesis polyprenyl glycosylphosphotransferase
LTTTEAAAPPLGDTGDDVGGDRDERAGGRPGDRWSWESAYLRALLTADFMATLVATLAAFVIRFQGAHYARWYLLLSALLPAAWLGVLALTHAYEKRRLFVGGDEYQRVIRAGVRLTVGMALASYLLSAELARGYLLITLVLTTALTLLGRFVLRRLVHRGRRRGAYMHRVLILGHASGVAAVTRQLHRRRYHGLQVIGACLPESTEPAATAAVAGVPVFGTFAAAANAAVAAGADTVVVLSCPELDGTLLRRLAWELERDDIDLIVSSSLVDTAGDRITVRPVDGLPMMHIEHPQFGGARRLLKNVFDVTLALLLLVVTAPLLLAIAIGVKRDAPGPVLFRQTRVGKNGETFAIVKFRTMYVDAEHRLEAIRADNDQSGVLFKIRQDPRITDLGRALRRWSLDELPQLFNVIAGHMSLVGPRPPLPAEVARYPQDMRRRLVVKPGMTGLWQVSGRADLSWDESIRLDLQYVENWSLTTDLVILMRTVTVVLRGSGAY